MLFAHPPFDDALDDTLDDDAARPDSGGWCDAQGAEWRVAPHSSEATIPSDAYPVGMLACTGEQSAAEAEAASDETTSAALDGLGLETRKPPLSPHARDLIRGLLTVAEARRLGCDGTGGPAGLRRHGWWDGLDWDALLQKRVPPPPSLAARALRAQARSKLADSPPELTAGARPPSPPFSLW
jgi:hypothetical protein|mmetsp:Transcript_36838/g.83370  ORF Transcript_36838/g.83370 Transcript_36838/m.83370 type:complete len:183 (-) Transcript_36838:528-1076(-)